MDHEIIKFAKQPNRTALKDYISSLQPVQIEELVRDKLKQPMNAGVDPVMVVRGILLGDPNGTQTRLIVSRTIIEWLGNDVENTIGSGSKVKLATTLINLILPEVEVLAPSMLEEMARLITQFIENNVPIQTRAFEILSKTYNLLAALEATDRTDGVLVQLCESNWHPQSAVGLVSCINEMELTSSQLNQVVKRMLNQLNELEIEEVPPFIYQLLLLSRKCNKRTILSGICDYFDWLHTTKAESDTSRMEGTVMLHISFAIKQDQELGTELVKYIKSDKILLLEKFKMACLLSAARIHRLEESIFDLLKQTIITVYKDSDKLESCIWISEYSKIDSKAIRQVVMDIVDRSASGWDQVIQSLTQLAMTLIDAATNVNPLKGPGSTQRSKTQKPGPLDQVISLGTDVLVKMFKLHDVARTEILEQITSRVVSQSSSSLYFLDLLEKLTTTCPYEVEKYIGHIKDTLDYLSLLSLSTAKKLISATQPVSISNHQFRDGLILVLRKSMFSRELDSRMIAVNGFLSLLRNQLGSASHSTSQTEPTSGAAFEILGLLRRCFSQQCEVRVAAYNGLGTLSENDNALAGDIFEILYTQFLRSFETDEGVVTPLRLSSCVENGVKSRLLEPIHLMLTNLLKALRNLKTGGYHSVISEALSDCKKHIKSLTFRLTKLDLEDYELDKASNFDTTTAVGLRSFHFADMLLGTFDTTLEHEFINNGDTVESCQTILALFKKRKALLGLLKENSSKDKGRKLAGLGISSLLSLEFSAKISQALFLHGDRQSPILTLRSDIDFMHYIVSVTPTILAEAVDASSYCQDDKYFGHCVTLVKVYIHILIHEDSDSSFINYQPQKGHSLLGSITASLKYILDLTYNVWPNRLPELLNQLRTMSGNSSEFQAINVVITDLLGEFKGILNKHLNTKPPLYKESVSTVQIIKFLINQMDHTQDDFENHSSKVTHWLAQIAKERPIEDTGVAKEIISLLIHLCAYTNKLDIIKEIAQDVHALQGEVDIDEDSQVEPTIQYLMINARTHGAITTQVLSFTELENDNMAWSIGRLKISASSGDWDHHYRFEQVVSNRLIHYVNIVSELIKSAMVGVHAEHLVKVLTKTYRTFTVFVKYKITAPKIEIPPEFIKLVANIGCEVTDKMYKFLTVYAHQRQEEYDLAGIGNKKGKKKEVNAKEKAKILREAKAIPSLIFVVEQFERHLIQLTRKSKVDLMQYMKRSTSRDFQIKLDNFMESEGESDDGSKKRPLLPDEEVYDDDDDEEEDHDQISISDSDQDGGFGYNGASKRARI